MSNLHIEFGSDIDEKANELFLSNNLDTNWLNNAYFFRSARDSLRFIAKLKSNISKRAFIPILCCDSMALPFRQNGYEIIYYPMNSDYSIDQNFIKNNINDTDIILVFNYFGLKSKESTESENEFINNIKNTYKDLTIIQDFTHTIKDALSANKSNFDFLIFSARKWSSIPDCGILWSKNALDIKYDNYDDTYFKLKKEAMYLKSLYLENSDKTIKEKFLSLFKEADNLLESSNEVINISDYSKELLFRLDFKKIYNTRLEHIKYMNSHCDFGLNENSINSGLYFPIYVDNQKELQTYLAQNNIYCPVIWPIDDCNKSVSNFATNLISHMLAIPCDQRYSFEELDYILNFLNKK